MKIAYSKKETLDDVAIRPTKIKLTNNNPTNLKKKTDTVRFEPRTSSVPGVFITSRQRAAEKPKYSNLL